MDLQRQDLHPRGHRGHAEKSKIDEPLERYSVIRSIRAIDNCDVAIFVIDAVDKLTEQDKKSSATSTKRGRDSSSSSINGTP